VENNPYPQTTTVTPKTSKAAVASLVCGILGLCLLVPSLFGGILGIIALIKINQSQGSLKGTGLAIGGLATSALSIITAGILASMLLPALARAKAKANRIKCVNNLGSIGKAHIGFSQDNSMRMPWQLTPTQKQTHFGSAASQGLSVGSIFGLQAMKMELQTPKILLSPSDPSRAAANETMQMEWGSYDTNTGNPIPTEDISYGLCSGGDPMRPSTVIALTKNIRSDLTSDWTGADEPLPHPHAFAGLNKSQGQLVLADGSAKQSTNADLGMSGKITQAHINSRGGVAKGNASTAVLR
jgi:hypothetical protein